MERLDPALLAIERGSLFLHERATAEASNARRAIPVTGQCPSWIRLLGRVMAATPQAERGICDALPFGELLARFIDIASEMLSRRISTTRKMLDERAIQSLERALAESIVEILAPCFLAEFAADRPIASECLGILIDDGGASAGDQSYRAFIARHRADGLREILTRYPVGARLAAHMIENWVSSSSELIARLAQDLPDIAARFLGEATTVADIEPRLSDPHAHGRSVAIVVFRDGRKVVYKPRSLAPEAAWRDFVGALGMPYAALAGDAIDRGTHGWMEYIAPQDCADEKSVRAYYRAAGALLCLARAFSLKDLHFENIVAAGDRPVPIDLETMAQPQPRSPTPTVLDRIAAVQDAVLDESVRDTEALPARHSLSDRPPLDISAFADLSSATRHRTVWRGQGTDAITRVFVEEEIPAANLPRLRGEICPPDGFVEEIIAGFEAAWAALRTTQPKSLTHIADLPVRFVFRATEIYYRLLDRACAPEKLRNGIDFSTELEALRRVADEPGFPAELGAIITAEIMALHGGDIPRFTALAGATAICIDHTSLLDDAFMASGLDAIRRRLDNLTPGRLALERRFIRASFHAARHGGLAEAIDLSGEPLSSDDALAAAIEIGHAIIETACPRADGGVSWITIAHRPETAGPMAIVTNESLYEGTTGIGVFLAALHRTTGESHWAEMAERAFMDARRIAHETPSAERAETITRLGLGFAGLGGLIYGLAVAGHLDDAAHLATWIDSEAIATQPSSDLLGGAAGAIPGLLAIEAHHPEARTVAMACGRTLAAHRDMSDIDGFGHGASGVDATLSLLDPSLRCTIDHTLPSSEVAHGPIGWCKGPIGQALAQVTAQCRKGASINIAAIEHAVDASLADHHALDQVCCGWFGGVEALLAAARCGRPYLSRKAHVLARALLERARRSGGFRLLAGLPPGFDSPGFFQGTSGIGYTLLRLTRPNLLPSILLTEWRA